MCYRLFQRNGVTRLLPPRLASSADRCAENLLKEVLKTTHRVGLDRGAVITAHMHGGGVVKTGYTTESSFAVLPRASRAKGGMPPGPPRTDPARKAYTPGQIHWMLYVRLHRLLRHFKIAFGAVIIEVAPNRIVRIRLIEDIRPDLDPLSVLAAYFAGAPPSAAWLLGIPVAPPVAP